MPASTIGKGTGRCGEPAVGMDAGAAVVTGIAELDAVNGVDIFEAELVIVRVLPATGGTMLHELLLLSTCCTLFRKELRLDSMPPKSSAIGADVSEWFASPDVRFARLPAAPAPS